MRIGFVCERMLTGFGVDLTVDALAEGLVRRGHDVTVYAAVDDGTYRHRSYTLRLIPTRPSRNFPLYEARAKKWVKLLDSDELDVVEIHTFPFFRLLPLLRTPTVAVDHGVSPSDGFPAWLRADFAYMRSRLYGSYLPRATRLVTISDFLRRDMPRALAERAQVVPWGAEHYWREVDPAEVAEYRARLGIPEAAVLSLYVGRLNRKGQPYKGVEELLAHFRAIRDTHPGAALLCLGFGNDADASAIRRAGGIARVKAPAAEMALAYSAADVLVSCSKWEGFGLPLLEAERFGVPAVVYRRGAHPEIARAGESAMLVDDPESFRAAWGELLDNPGRRAAMSQAAVTVAREFTWERSIAAHEAVLEEAVAAATRGGVPALNERRRADETERREPLVSVIVLTYRPEPETLANCLDSIARSTYSRMETVVVDNGSGDGVAARLCEGRAHTRFIALERNLGFSAGINRGVAASSGSLCFILNPDTVVEADAVECLVEAAKRRPRAVGFAAKMLFLHDRELIDSVGIAMDQWGAAFNRGIGQLDIGQFDEEERVLGACFGAAMVRREAFRPGHVGPLDEGYFLYYEDVDWCVRATLLGEDFWTAPDARVYHVHSATTREQAYAFKYHHIERNLLFTAFKNFEKRRAIRVFLRQTRAHVRNVIRGRFAWATVKVLVQGWLGVPRYWSARHVQQLRRVRADHDWLKLSHGERPHFNPTNYSPEYNWPTALAMVQRKWMVTEEEKWERAYNYLSVAVTTPRHYQPQRVLEQLRRLAGPLPPPLERFFEIMRREEVMLQAPSDVPVELESSLAPGKEASQA